MKRILVAFLWIAFVFLQMGWTGVGCSTQGEQFNALGILGAGTAFLLHNLVDYSLSIPQVTYSWWAIFGLMAAQGHPNRPGFQEKLREKWLDLWGSHSTLVSRGLQAVLFFVLLGLIFSIDRGLLGRGYYLEAREALQKREIDEADLMVRRAVAVVPLEDAYHHFNARLSADRIRQSREIEPDLIERAVREYGWSIQLNPWFLFIIGTGGYSTWGWASSTELSKISLPLSISTPRTGPIGITWAWPTKARAI